MELLENLTNCFGVSGFEKNVIATIENEIKSDDIIFKRDKIGNLFAFKNKNSDFKNVLLCAHMDEVGFVITRINENGLLSFDIIGGVNTDLLVGRRVCFDRSGIEGIIVLIPEDFKDDKKALVMNHLFIDIGALNKQDAECKIKKGDYAVFLNSFRTLGENYIISKALDDRAGCMLNMKLLNQNFDLNLIGTFTIQEEIGLRGSKNIDRLMEADVCIIVDCTPSFDFLNSNSKDAGCILGKGPVLNIFDSKAIYDKKIINDFINIAKRESIPYQIKMKVSGSTDAAELKFKGKCLNTVVISIPCKFIHTCSTIINVDDLKNTYSLIYNYLKILEHKKNCSDI